MCLYGAGRKNVVGETNAIFFHLEFFVMGCLNLSMEISFGTKSGHQVI